MSNEVQLKFLMKRMQEHIETDVNLFSGETASSAHSRKQGLLQEFLRLRGSESYQIQIKQFKEYLSRFSSYHKLTTVDATPQPKERTCIMGKKEKKVRIALNIKNTSLYTHLYRQAFSYLAGAFILPNQNLFSKSVSNDVARAKRVVKRN